MRPVQDLHCIQRGTALVMTLIFLVLLTILGITAINISALEEKMAGNSKDQNLAFQAAETALRAGESWVGSTTSATALDPDPANGIHAPADPSLTPTVTTPEIWESIAWTGAGPVQYKQYSGILPLGVSTNPKYIIEKLDSEPAPSGGTTIIVRVTARGTGASDSTVSMVQSTYAKTYPP
jgi:type IV pilus assembly protein PilX